MADPHGFTAHGAMRPQLRLVHINGADRRHMPGTPHDRDARAVPGPAVHPLGAPYLDVDLAAMERHAVRRAQRAAARAELDAMLAARAEAHISSRGTLRNMTNAARWALWIYLAMICAVVCVAGYAWWLQ